MTSTSDAEDKLRIAGDQVGGDKITGGDIAGSVAAIGAGASVIYHKVERALTEIESLEQAQEFENKVLAEALTDYVHRLERQAARAEEDPGDGNPYKALLEFDIQDAALFYGRTIAIRELLAHIKRDQLTVLHAGSGLGKTSLLKAGIMPRLLASGSMPLYLRPYQTPVHVALKRALLVNLDETPQLARTTLHDFLRRATSLMNGGQMIVIIDQFEELFTIQDEQARNEFIDQFTTCLDDDLLPVRWIIALRDEWFGQLGTLRPQIRNPYANEFLLRPLTRAEATLVITQPAARRQVSYEPALVERLMNDMGRDEIAPPHLQLVCSMLFDSLPEGQTQITQAMYEEAGEAKGILRGYLYRVLSRDMPPEMRAPAQRLLEALVTSEKRRALRTREELTTEVAAWGFSLALVNKALNQLTDSRLLRVEEFMLDKVHSIPAYELAHDYLLEEIDIAPEVQARKAAQELVNQKLPFYKREKLLLSPQELAIVLPQRQWLVLSDDANALLRESQAIATRQKRMRRIGIAAVVLLVIAAISAIAIQQNISAKNYKSLANAARSRELAAQAQLEKNLGDALATYRDAAQSYETDPSTSASRDAMYAALSIPLPEKIFTISNVDVVSSVNFSSKGDKIVLACSDHVARILDVKTRKTLLILQGEEGHTHTEGLRNATFSPDDRLVATVGLDGNVGIWDAQSGKQIRFFPAHKGEAYSAIFSPDGTRLVTAGQDKTAAVWDVETGKELFRMPHEAAVRFASYSPDGKRIVTASADKTAVVWDALTGSEILPLKGHKDRVTNAHFSPNGKYIVTASNDRTARVWDAQTGEGLAFLVPHNGNVLSANFSPDGKYIVTSSDDHLVRVWNSENGALIATYPGHTDHATWATFSPDGKWIASSSNDSTVWLRNALQIAGSASFIGHTNGVNTVIFNRDGSRIITASADKTAAIWEVKSGKRLATLEGHTSGVLFATFSPDGQQVATISGDNTVRIWDGTNGKEIQNFPVDGNSVNYSSKGNQLVTGGSEEESVQVWDTQTWEEIPPAMKGHQAEVNFAVFSPDDRVIASASEDGTVRIWDAKTHHLLHTLQIFPTYAIDEVNSVSFSPGGRYLAVAADAGVAEIWDYEQEKMVLQLNGLDADIRVTNYSPDGRLLVTSSDDHTVRLWDVKTGIQLAVMQGHTDEVHWATFSPIEGEWIYSSSNDRTVRTWMVDPDELYQFIHSELDRVTRK